MSPLLGSSRSSRHLLGWVFGISHNLPKALLPCREVKSPVVRISHLTNHGQVGSNPRRQSLRYCAYRSVERPMNFGSLGARARFPKALPDANKAPSAITLSRVLIPDSSSAYAFSEKRNEMKRGTKSREFCSKRMIQGKTSLSSLRSRASIPDTE